MHGTNIKKIVTSRLYLPERYKILIQFTELVTKLVNFMVQKDLLPYSQNVTTGLYSTMTPHSTRALFTPIKYFDSPLSPIYIQDSSSETKMCVSDASLRILHNAAHQIVCLNTLLTQGQH